MSHPEVKELEMCKLFHPNNIKTTKKKNFLFFISFTENIKPRSWIRAKKNVVVVFYRVEMEKDYDRRKLISRAQTFFTNKSQ
jgi:hypothetical protein